MQVLYIVKPTDHAGSTGVMKENLKDVIKQAKKLSFVANIFDNDLHYLQGIVSRIGYLIY